MKRKKKPIQERCIDLALKLMDDLRWDSGAVIPFTLQEAADRITALEKKNADLRRP